MADDIDISRADLSRKEQIALLCSGVGRWNAWRKANPSVSIDLSLGDLAKRTLEKANLQGANLQNSLLMEAKLWMAHLAMSDLQGAHLEGADLTEANLQGAHLEGAHLSEANLTGANLTEANLQGASLERTILVQTLLTNANLDGCYVYGVSVWDAQLDGAKQTNLRIEPMELTREVRVQLPGFGTWISVDDLEVAQFLYLMLHNEKIRQVIDTLTSKVVLILGRFSEERKPVLEALRNTLRSHSYVPVLFDFSGPENRDFTETVTLLARMARFVIADITDPASIPHELAKIVPDAQVPVQPLLLEGSATYSMFQNLYMHPLFMLPVVTYTTVDDYVATLPLRVIRPAEARVAEIQRVRATELLNSGLPR